MFKLQLQIYKMVNIKLNLY